MEILESEKWDNLPESYKEAVKRYVRKNWKDKTLLKLVGFFDNVLKGYDYRVVMNPENISKGGLLIYVYFTEKQITEIYNELMEEKEEYPELFKKESTFKDAVIEVTRDLQNLLIEKNLSYGNAALNPINVFSKADSHEQLRMAIDNKLTRIQRGKEFGNEDSITDLIGYLILFKIQRDYAIR